MVSAGFDPKLAIQQFGNLQCRDSWALGHWKKQSGSQLRHLTQQDTESSIGMVFISCTTGFGSMMGFCTAIVDAVRQEALRLAHWDQALYDELSRWSITVRLPGMTAS